MNVTMKAWRVGSLSMGVTLLLLGSAIAVSIWSGLNSINMLLWVAPLVFILLGLELLAFLWLAGSDRIVMRYDWMSLFFVAVIGAGAIVLASFTSTGLLDTIRDSLKISERTVAVQTEAVAVPDTVKKIVVQSFDGVRLDEGESRDAKLLGQVQYRSVEPFEHSEPLMTTETVGSTMYIMIGSYQQKDTAVVTDMYHPMLTLVLPKGVKVEPRGF
ncbi:hypothetical protein [Paenibacillus sp. NEAU-GSW1]|uniref:hypothetical protein n=1 Tax=Paenibacillus sp. NEAU-GSW1 TaxID=2682486 RepID=UPI0012E19324|nr:hypothetical protein [Paenibacillus sp. NEAU-GSW1]MUT67903.1 hypothetical protein [Paenibacillus sp. NEAU-GSW1]